MKVSGLAATTEILHSEVANDRLEVDSLTGTDTVGSGGLAGCGNGKGGFGTVADVAGSDEDGFPAAALRRTIPESTV